jgi:CRISPR system Cascade subunit CasA
MELEGKTVLLSIGSEGNRISAKAAKGVLGDPWTPLVDGGGKAWTVRPPVFSPKNLTHLLFETDGFIAPAFSKAKEGWESRSAVLSGSVLAPAGMGKTDGFHEVTIPIPAKVARRLFRNGPERDRLASLSRTAIDDSATMQNRVLKPAVLSLLEAGPERVDFDKREVSGWWEHTQRDFAADWSADFFPWLWRTVEHPDAEAARLDWLQALQAKARAALQAAIARYPSRQGRRYRGRVRAEDKFRKELLRQFPQLKEKRHDTAEAR